MQSIRGVKFRQFRAFYWPILRRGILLPLTDPPATFQFILLLAFLGALEIFLPKLAQFESLSVSDQGRWAVWLVALVFVAIPIWIVYQSIVSAFKAKRAIDQLGTWDGGVFRYYEPLLVSMSTFKPAEHNDLACVVTFDDAPAGSLVRWETEIEGPRSRTSAHLVQVGGMQIYQALSLQNTKGGGSGGLRINDKRQAWLIANASPETDISVIRVRMRSWEL